MPLRRDKLHMLRNIIESEGLPVIVKKENWSDNFSFRVERVENGIAHGTALINGEEYHRAQGEYLYHIYDLFYFLGIPENGIDVEDPSDIPEEEINYPVTLLAAAYRIKEEDIPSFIQTLPEDIEGRVNTVYEEAPSDRTRIVLEGRYKEKRTLENIGNELGVSRERIRQLQIKFLKYLRSKKVKAYLLDIEDPLMQPPREENSPNTLYPFALVQPNSFEYSDTAISISEIARKLEVLKTEEQNGKLSYKYLADWLVENQYLTFDPDRNPRRLPTEAGNEIGISVETRTNQSGDNYQVVVCSRQAQEFIVENYPRFAVHKTE